jgi:hypothetical protein
MGGRAGPKPASPFSESTATHALNELACTAPHPNAAPAPALPPWPSAVGNLAFVQSHASLVNARRIMFVNDVITMVPCVGAGDGERGMPACNIKATQGGRVSVWSE